MDQTSEAKQMAEVAQTEATKLSAEVIKEIKTAEDMALAADQLTAVKTQQKNLKATRDKYILPMKRAVEDLERDLFNPPKVALEELERTLKSAMLIYQRAVYEKARKAEAKIERQVDAGRMDMATAVNKSAKIQQAPTQVQAAGGGEVRFNTIRKVRLVDLTKVPAWVFADPKVTAALEAVAKPRALKEGVAGFEVYEEKTVAGYGR